MTSQYKENHKRALAVRLSAELLRDCRVASFPLDIEQMLIRPFQKQLYLCPYSSVGKADLNELEGQAADPCQISKDGFCYPIHDALLGFRSLSVTGSIWNIYYNDSSLPERIRFTLLHELGHVFMGHHYLLGAHSTVFPENTPEYWEADNQADLFAINALAPAPSVARLLREHGFTYDENTNEWHLTDRNAIFLRNLGRDPDPLGLIRVSFEISATAAKRRLAELHDELQIWETLDPALYSYLDQIGHRAGWYCWVCHTRRRSPSPYCTGCGNGWSYEYKDTGHPSRPVIKLKGNGRFAFCSVCGNSEYSDQANFCPVCGAPVMNDCLNARNTDGDFIRSGRHIIRGTHHCKPSDIYCGSCGVLTTFGEQHGPRKNLWLPVSESDRCRINSASYPPIFDTEEQTLKACPSCGSKRTIRDGRYCADCMQPLNNCCIGGMNGAHPCTPNDRYCSVCGQPTIFFHAGYLVAYTDTTVYQHLRSTKTSNHDYEANQMMIHIDGSRQVIDTEEA